MEISISVVWMMYFDFTRLQVGLLMRITEKSESNKSMTTPQLVIISRVVGDSM